MDWLVIVAWFSPMLLILPLACLCAWRDRAYRRALRRRLKEIREPHWYVDGIGQYWLPVAEDEADLAERQGRTPTVKYVESRDSAAGGD